METRSDIGGAAQARGEIRATVVQLAVSLPCQPTVAAMLRAAAAAGGAGAAPFCSGLPLAGLRGRRSSTGRLSPAALPRSLPCPSPCPRSSQVLFRCRTLGHVGRSGPLPRLPHPTGHPPPAAPLGCPGEAPALSFSRRALARPCQGAPRAGLASPTCCARSGPEAAGEAPLWCGRTVEAGGATGAARAAGRLVTCTAMQKADDDLKVRETEKRDKTYYKMITEIDSSEQISSASPFRGDLPVKCP
ncbi:uncharacterized protein LOC104695099 [Corvus cornix cornix]|uniref:uncharacterized protein LOC104695099 n=1 Tax=Corvus cornix cornix TaxID=932674 RepID=UPI0019516BFB|nr:uncharacterized protein LOC104695099 [Corvus cornix cornix]